MDVLRGFSTLGKGVCHNADLYLFLTTRMHVWAPSMIAGGLMAGAVYKGLGYEEPYTLLLATALGSAAGLGISFSLDSDHSVSKGCAQVEKGVEKAAGWLSKKK